MIPAKYAEIVVKERFRAEASEWSLLWMTVKRIERNITSIPLYADLINARSKYKALFPEKTFGYETHY